MFLHDVTILNRVSIGIPDLAERGIHVSPALVSQVKKRMKQAGGPEGQKAATKKSAGKKSPQANTLTAENLVEAKKLVTRRKR